MPPYRNHVVSCPALLPRAALLRMIRLVRLLHHLSQLPAYRDLVLPLVPPAARHDPRHAAVMMGYDFHLDPAGHPWLIEVNTNAGGGLLSYLAHHPAAALATEALSARLRQRFLATFAEELRLFSGGSSPPQHIAIVDERPPEQFLYREMEIFSDLFRQAWGTRVTIADPTELKAGEDGVFAGGERIDLVYNRHCDFYLESPPLAGLRAAWLAGNVCLTPNPFLYGLLADKRRMVLWSSAPSLRELGMRAEDGELLAATVPETRLLAALDRDEVWRHRSAWVFKPVDRFGSRGVFLGRKISRARFDTLVAEQTLVQQEIPPSITPCGEEGPMKTDFRLYAYRDRILGMAARLYRGQVTNMQAAGAGFAPVQVI
jgi:hypothetical protein